MKKVNKIEQKIYFAFITMASFLIVGIAHASEEAAAGGSPVAVLGINLKLFIAQLVNFGIVILILWKWVFTPVANKLNERTEKIEKAMKDAVGTEKEKQEFASWKQQEIAKTKSEAAAIIIQANKEAGTVKDDLLKQAKEEQQKLVDNTKKQIEQEKHQILQSAKSELADMVTQAAEKIIKEKLTSDKDKKFIKDTLSEIK